MSWGMSQDESQGTEFWEHLTRVDLACAERVRQGGCASCGGALDRADYGRKPRGDLGEASPAYARRVSFCCRRDGCRRRATPPSVRFLGRKVYVGAKVVEASVAGQTALAPEQRPRARVVEGVPARSVRRWLGWWQTAFALGSFWLEARAFFARPVDVAGLPASLLARFGARATTALERFLQFVSPVTTTSVRARISMAG